MKDNARKSAEIIIADAEVKAEKILNRRTVVFLNFTKILPN